ncbi:MAG: hypothetical protein MK033_04075 [Candidatus Caenarcaniphilales bacterium]|nr:hypothetical protein [Candidatus Caenarcaniphilales bacterium]
MDHINNANNNNKFGAEVAQKELVIGFFSTRNLENYSLYQSLALDLYRSITFYRTYGKVEKFVEAHPDFTEYKEDIQELWLEFDQMSDEELAEVSIRILSDL